MEITKRNKFVEFIKNYWMYVAVAVVVLVIAITVGVLAGGQTVPTTAPKLEFSLPMNEANIIKDYSSTELQENTSLNQWEAHLSVDFASENSDVFAVLDGTVTKVSYDVLNGHLVEITHNDGFVSQYSSLADEPLVSEGDKVSAGEKIGTAGNSSNAEIDLGNHLHFTLYLNQEVVDPNNYLDLQNK